MKTLKKIAVLIFFVSISMNCKDAQAWLRWDLGFTWSSGTPATYYPRYFVWPYFVTARYPLYPSYYRYRPSVLYPMTYRYLSIGPAFNLGEAKKMAWLQSKMLPSTTQPTPEIQNNPKQIPDLKKEEVPLLRIQPEVHY